MKRNFEIKSPDQLFNCAVSLAEAIVDAPTDEMRQHLLENLKSFAPSIIEQLEQFKTSQAQCPDYFLHQGCSPKFLMERIRLFAKCLHRTHGTPSADSSRKRRPVLTIPQAHSMVCQACQIMIDFEKLVCDISHLLAKPSAESLNALYHRMDMAVNVSEHLHDDILTERDKWFSRYKKGRPSAAKLDEKRRSLLHDIELSQYAALADVLAEQYDSIDELHTAVARCYYANYIDFPDRHLCEYMEYYYQYEAYMDLEPADAQSPSQAEKSAPIEGLAEMQAALDEDPSILASGYSAESFGQLFAVILRDPACREFLTYNAGANYKGLNIASFCNVIGLMLSHLIFDAGQTALAKFFFEDKQGCPGMLQLDTIRKYIGGGIQFERDEFAVLKPKIESAIRMVKKGQV